MQSVFQILSSTGATYIKRASRLRGSFVKSMKIIQVQILLRLYFLYENVITSGSYCFKVFVKT